MIDSDARSRIESIVAGGKGIVAADDQTIIEIVKGAINSGLSAHFYLSPAQADMVKSWYWTPERRQSLGPEPISADERHKIENELEIRNLGDFAFRRITCGCGEVYGAYEFLQQGLREHGPDLVNAVFELRGVVLLRVNPHLTPICPACESPVDIGEECITYEGDTYGGCSYCGPPVSVP